MPPPRKKRPPAGQSVPGERTFSAHRDALRRASGTAGQKPPGRGRKNSPRRRPGAVRRLRPRGSGGQWGCLVAESDLTGCPPRQRARPGAKTATGGGRGLCTDCAHGGGAGNGGWCRLAAALWTPAGAEGTPERKTAPGGAGGCLDAGYGCYLPRAIRVI